MSGYCGPNGIVLNCNAVNWNSDSTGIALEFKNLQALGDRGDWVELHQNSKFFFIPNPNWINEKAETVDFLGWKAHISVDLDDLELAFDLASPILRRYGFCFLVINPARMNEYRFTAGAQFTVFFEQNGKQVCSEERVCKMMNEISHAFETDGIGYGVKPDSDAATFTPYFSVRNDAKIDFQTGNVSYLPASLIGKNFNPFNVPIPFSSILGDQNKWFDPAEHLRSFDLELTHCTPFAKDEHFCYTAMAFVREHTKYDLLSKEERQVFVANCCVDGEKKSDGTEDEVVQAVVHAVKLITMFRVGRPAFHEYIQSAQLSTNYPFDNAFKEFLELLEQHSNGHLMRLKSNASKEMFNSYLDPDLSLPNKFDSLTDLLMDDAMNLLEDIPETCWPSVFHNAHFYHSLAALTKIRIQMQTEPKKYEKFLIENKSVPAAQYELASRNYQDYWRKFALSKNAKWVGFTILNAKS